MKVIDILNKIANGEKVRFRILDNDEIRDEIFEVENGQLRNSTCGKWLETRVSIDTWESISSYFLNEEVELIEEEKGIPEEIRWHEENGVGEEDDAFYVDVNGKSQYVDSEYDSWEMTTILKINEIIDYLKSKGE